MENMIKPISQQSQDHKHDSDEDPDNYDQEDPFSNEYKLGDIVAIDDVDNKNRWHIGEIVALQEENIDLHYYGAYHTQNRHRAKWMRAWFTEGDDRAAYKMSRPKNNEPWLTDVQKKAIFYRHGNRENNNWENEGFFLKEKTYKFLDKERSARWKQQNKVP